MLYNPRFITSTVTHIHQTITKVKYHKRFHCEGVLRGQSTETESLLRQFVQSGTLIVRLLGLQYVLQLNFSEKETSVIIS
jgi:hypothetical protein